MKKNNLIVLVIAIVLIVAIVTYIYFNPTKPEPTKGEYITTEDLASFCNLEDVDNCFTIPCEGENVDITGYTKWGDMELRGLKGLGKAQTNLPIVYLGEGSENFYDLRSNYFWTGVTMKEAVETDDSLESANAITAKLIDLGVARDEMIIVKIKNAKIVGFDGQTMNDCVRGISLQASYNDIIFEKIN